MGKMLRPVDEAKWSAAKSEVRDWLLSIGATLRTLSDEEVSLYRISTLISGWRLNIPYDDKMTLEVDFLLPNDFPWSKPKIALINRPAFREWPHIESNGIMCLIPSSATLVVGDPVAMAKKTLHEVVKLIDRVNGQDNSSDFQSEFHSYWPDDKDSLNVKSLLSLAGPSRKIISMVRKNLCLVADDRSSAQDWLANILKLNKEKIKGDGEGILIVLDEPLIPERYPENIEDILSLIGGNISLLHEAIEHLPQIIPIVIAAPASTGMTICAVLIEGHFRTDGYRSIFRGFRKEIMPANILSDRYLQSSKIKKVKVERVDSQWVHGRDTNSNVSNLQNICVGVIGCGSLGGYIAYNLAQAGIGGVHLIDPETLSHANTGRHILGGREVGLYKAEALANKIRSAFPHISSVTFSNKSWQEVASEKPDSFEDMDLIISTVADWASESALNAYHIDSALACPILYGWTEPHAVAGHALLINKDAGCFSCNMSTHGNCEEKVSEWPNGSGLTAEPGCGSYFQPYGPIELSHTVNLISELALDYLTENQDDSVHRMWASKERNLQRSGGVWSAFWQSHPEWSQGGIEVQRPWLKTTGCKVCG